MEWFFYFLALFVSSYTMNVCDFHITSWQYWAIAFCIIVAFFCGRARGEKEAKKWLKGHIRKIIIEKLESKGDSPNAFEINIDDLRKE